MSKLHSTNVIRESHYKMQLCTHFHQYNDSERYDDKAYSRNWNKTPFIHKMQN